MGQFGLGSLLDKGKKALEEEARKRLHPNAPSAKESFQEAHGPMWSDKPKEGNPEFVVSNTVPGAKGKGGKPGPATTSYYRVDIDESGKFSARKLEKAEVVGSVAGTARTTAQLQAELKTANSPAALNDAIDRAARADELVGKAKKADYRRDEKADNKLHAIVQNGTPEQAREAIISDLEKTSAKLEKLSDKQMDPAQKESIAGAISGDMDKLERAQNLSDAIPAAMQAINPTAATPKADPLAAPKMDPLAARP